MSEEHDYGAHARAWGIEEPPATSVPTPADAQASMLEKYLPERELDACPPPKAPSSEPDSARLYALSHCATEAAMALVEAVDLTLINDPRPRGRRLRELADELATHMTVLQHAPKRWGEKLSASENRRDHVRRALMNVRFSLQILAEAEEDA